MDSINKIKQVIILRKDLNMRKGKMVAQGAHASMACITQLLSRSSRCDHDGTDRVMTYDMVLPESSPVHQWLEGKFTKITLSVNSEAELLALYQQAKATGLLCSLIQDAGDTEFHGVPTYTAIAIGPDYASEIDPLTRSLALL